MFLVAVAVGKMTGFAHQGDIVSVIVTVAVAVAVAVHFSVRLNTQHRVTLARYLRIRHVNYVERQILIPLLARNRISQNQQATTH